MANEIKPVVSYDGSFAMLDIRVGRIVEATFVSPAVNAKVGSKLF